MIKELAQAKLDSLQGKTIEVPAELLYKVQEFLIASSCMFDEGKLPNSFDEVANMLGYEIYDLAKNTYTIIDDHPQLMYGIYDLCVDEAYKMNDNLNEVAINDEE